MTRHRSNSPRVGILPRRLRSLLPACLLAAVGLLVIPSMATAQVVWVEPAPVYYYAPAPVYVAPAAVPVPMTAVPAAQYVPQPAGPQQQQQPLAPRPGSNYYTPAASSPLRDGNDSKTVIVREIHYWGETPMPNFNGLRAVPKRSDVEGGSSTKRPMLAPDRSAAPAGNEVENDKPLPSLKPAPSEEKLKLPPPDESLRSSSPFIKPKAPDGTSSNGTTEDNAAEDETQLKALTPPPAP